MYIVYISLNLIKGHISIFMKNIHEYFVNININFWNKIYGKFILFMNFFCSQVEYTLIFEYPLSIYFLSIILLLKLS